MEIKNKILRIFGNLFIEYNNIKNIFYFFIDFN